jgi:hypothetical protein
MPDTMDMIISEMLLQRQRLAAARVVIEDSHASTVSPEGVVAKMPLKSLLRQVVGTRPNTADLVLPDGVKAVVPQGPLTICVWESPPGLHRLTWIATDSPAPYGPQAKYRQVRLALPYLIILAVFDNLGSDQLHLSQRSECFFRNTRLKSLDEELCYPALLNCYGRGGPGEPRPLSWICAGNLRSTLKMRRASSVSESLLAGLDAIRHYLLETGFTHSDGQGGRLSWFEASRSLDPRLNTVEAWEEASAKDPLFVLEVPWLKSGYTVRRAIERMLPNGHRLSQRQPNAATLARHILNHQAGVRPLPFVPEI